ncbi:MAG: nuclear transport factor 2 family protein [Bacteroidota bacterium]
MNANEKLITKFYSAFQQKDFLVMQTCYHPEATFNDPVFRNLNSKEVKSMWQMLLTSSKDLRIEFSDIHSNDQSGSAHWEAWYSFSRTGRQVHNIIDATFEFRDGLIYRHHDHFNFWKWSRQALGTSGTLLGWSPVVKNKVRDTARRSLDKFMQ